MKSLDDLLARGLNDRVFSQARAVVRSKGQVIYEGGSASAEAIFDLASVTKVMSTTAMLCRLSERGALDVRAPIRSLLPNVRVDATVADLAFHRSGLPAFLPFFAQVSKEHPALFERPTPELQRLVRAEVVARVLDVPAERSVGAAAVYSDLGFILLGEAIATVAKKPLDEAFTEEVAAPLGLASCFRPRSPHIVDTGGTRPREPAPGQEGLWQCQTWPSRPGEVDDDNAWVMNGVAGHAGLFSTAADVARFGQAVLDGWLVSPLGWSVDSTTPGSTRTFGFDTPSAEGASCGPRFGRAGTRGAIGHLGFTGTSLWIDFDRELVVTLLTNRVVFGRANIQIRAFRQAFHEAVIDALG